MFILKLRTYWMHCPKWWHNFFKVHFSDSCIEASVDEVNRILLDYRAKYIDNNQEIYLEFNTQEDLSYFILKYS